MNAIEQTAQALGFPTVVLPDAAASSMESAVRFLVDRLIADGYLHAGAADEVVRSIMKREFLGSTARNGVAVPRAISWGLDRVIGILAESSTPVPWEAPNVRTICLILAPTERVGDFGRALEQVYNALR